MKEMDIQRMLDIGITLSAEKDYNRLLERILADAMSILNCDAGTLYLKKGDFLEFAILRNDTMKSYQGGDGKLVGLPPVPITRESVCALAVLENRTVRVDDVENCREYNLSGPKHYDALTGYRTRSILVVPLKDRGDENVGVLQLLNARDEQGKDIPFPQDQVRIVESIASQAAVSIQNMRYVESIRDLFYSLVGVLSTAIDERTPYNASHTRHMVEYGRRFITYLNDVGDGAYYFSDKQKEELLMSVWFHDIGKLVTPLEVMNKASRLRPGRKERIMERIGRYRLVNRIECLEGHIGGEEAEQNEARLEEARCLVEQADTAGFLSDETVGRVRDCGKSLFRDGDGEMKPLLEDPEIELLTIRRGTLSEDERAVMEHHVVLTHKLLSQIHFPPEYSHVREWASCHHEFLNGRGYPNQLSGGDIPREVRIITILDIFDALTAGDRPYKKGMPVEKALSILAAMADEEGKLDAELTRLFTQSRCWESQ